VFYNATRRLVLKGVDGIVFVADSQEAAFDGNRESLSNLEANLAEQSLTLAQVPMVFQYNKRDIRKITSVDALQEALNPGGAPYFEAAALHGLGVFETLKGISRLALARIKQKIAEDTERETAPRPAPPPIAPPVIPEPAAEPEPPLPAVVEAPPPALASVPSEVDEVFSRLVPPALTPDTAPSHLEVEFAEEDTGKHVVRPVRMKGALDIQTELAKLRALTTTSSRPAPRRSTREADPRLDEFMGMPRSSRLDLKRKAGVEVPAHRLATASDVKLHLTFVGPDGEERVENAVTLKLGGHRPLDRLNLRLDLEIKGKS
jgi:hypothetical protein